MKIILPAILLVILTGCHTARVMTANALHPAISHSGRCWVEKTGHLVLVGSGSYGETLFKGDSCILEVQNGAGVENHNYLVVELDDNYYNRFKIGGDSIYKIKIFSSTIKNVAILNAQDFDNTYYISPKPTRNNKAPKSPQLGIPPGYHQIRIIKATEAQNGTVSLCGISAKGIKAAPIQKKIKIEFIGNSITCGMGDDSKEIPCGKGKWYDQHNAYWAYGPRVARALGMDYMISGVSGIGIYRNWNSDGPTMPQVYESAYLDKDSLQRWDFTQFQPDIVSICLGTNDFSNGDGKTPRLPFDSARFVGTYLEFLNSVYQHYPQANFAFLSSPMVSGPKAVLFLHCLETIQNLFSRQHPAALPTYLFNFEPMHPNGCSFHPDAADHLLMAQQLIPFFKKISTNRVSLQGNTYNKR